MDDNRSGRPASGRLGLGDTLYKEKLQIIEVINRSQRSDVFRCRTRSSAKDIVVKMSCEPTDLSTESYHRMEREGRKLKDLRSEYVGRYLGAWIEEIQGAKFVANAQQFITGRSLRDYLDSQGPSLPVTTAIRITLDIAKGLTVIHEAAIIHRDLKPENVMLAENPDHAVIVDFDIASFQDGTFRFTKADQYRGTPGWSAPEQAHGLDVTPATDLYTLGLIFYSMLTGSNPCDSPEMSNVTRLLAAQNSPRGGLKPNRNLIPRPLQSLISEMTKRNPASRIESAQAVVKRLSK